MPTDAPDGLINQHVVTGSAKARKAATKKAADKPADVDTAAPKSDKG